MLLLVLGGNLGYKMIEGPSMDEVPSVKTTMTNQMILKMLKKTLKLEDATGMAGIKDISAITQGI